MTPGACEEQVVPVSNKTAALTCNLRTFLFKEFTQIMFNKKVYEIGFTPCTNQKERYRIHGIGCVYCSNLFIYLQIEYISNENKLITADSIINMYIKNIPMPFN
jgi:hypothetical protein